MVKRQEKTRYMRGNTLKRALHTLDHDAKEEAPAMASAPLHARSFETSHKHKKRVKDMAYLPPMCHPSRDRIPSPFTHA